MLSVTFAYGRATSLTHLVQLENKKQPNLMGYSPLLSGNNDPSNSGDLQEGYEFGFEPVDGKTGEGTIIGGGKNVWPGELPEFREKALKY